MKSATEKRFSFLRKNNFRNSKKTTERILGIYKHSSDTPASHIANAKIALGDWYIWPGKPEAAQKQYQEAFKLLTASDDSETLIDQSFGKPLELPAANVFQPGRIAPKTKHHDDVMMQFTVTKFGKTSNIKTVITDPHH